MSGVIVTEGLGKCYGGGAQAVRALDDVSVTIARGAFVAVMGPSGSGKSTFMNLLGCLDTPSSGRYRLEGLDMGRLPADARARIRRRHLGFVFQSFNLLPHLSALDNVALPLVYAGVPARQRLAQAAALLAEMGLAGRAHHRPAQLSGGQQQRVAIARALVNSPAVILADEPTGALDSRTGLEILALFQRVNRAGTTVVLVTHDAGIAAHAGRVLQFRDGRLAADDSVAEPRDAAAVLAGTPA